MGYAPPTVYKVARQLRRAGQLPGNGSAPVDKGAVTGDGMAKKPQLRRSALPGLAAQRPEVNPELTPLAQASGDVWPLREQLADLETRVRQVNDKVDQLARVIGDANLCGGVSAWTQATFFGVLRVRGALHRIGPRLGVDVDDLLKSD